MMHQPRLDRFAPDQRGFLARHPAVRGPARRETAGRENVSFSALLREE
jgi:hypothetical protein